MVGLNIYKSSELPIDLKIHVLILKGSNRLGTYCFVLRGLCLDMIKRFKNYFNTAANNRTSNAHSHFLSLFLPSSLSRIDALTHRTYFLSLSVSLYHTHTHSLTPLRKAHFLPSLSLFLCAQPHTCAHTHTLVPSDHRIHVMVEISYFIPPEREQ